MLAGDGALALFGAPRAHEDDPERAVLAGLGICREIGAYAEAMARDWKLTEFGVRVGIETGLAVLGIVAGRRIGCGRAVGDVLNTAARLQSQAAPGTVLVGETTRRAVAAQFEWGVSQEFDLKGKAEPVMATVALRPSRTIRRSGECVQAAAPLFGTGGRARGDRARGGRPSRRPGLGGACVGGPGRRQEPPPERVLLTAQGGAAPSERSALWLEGRCRRYAESEPYAIYTGLVAGVAGARARRAAGAHRRGLAAALADLRQEPENTRSSCARSSGCGTTSAARRPCLSRPSCSGARSPRSAGCSRRLRSRAPSPWCSRTCTGRTRRRSRSPSSCCRSERRSRSSWLRRAGSKASTSRRSSSRPRRGCPARGWSTSRHCRAGVPAISCTR